MMRTWLQVSAAGLAAIGSLTPQQAQGAWHEQPFLLQAGGRPIDLGEVDANGHAAPYMADMNGDGRRDLIVGSFSGKFRLYLNSGTDRAPRFSDSAWVQAAGRDAQVPNFCCVAAGVQAMDIDKDGIVDLSSGSYYPGMVYWFKGLPKGGFGERHLLVNGAGIPIGFNFDPKNGRIDSYKVNVAWTHWDDDGHLDAIIGDNGGRLYVQLGWGKNELPWTSIPSQPLFDLTRKEILMGAERALPEVAWKGQQPQTRSAAPAVADWDGDGLWDILAGSSDGSVHWFRNTGKAGAPEFKSRVELLGPGAAFQWLESVDNPRPGQRTQIHPVDYDLDGKLDLLIGDWTVTMSPRRDLDAGERTRLKTLLAELDALDKEVDFQFDHARGRSLSYAPAWGAKPDAKPRAQALEQLLLPYLMEYAREEGRTTIPAHGRVWVYLRR